MLGGAFLASVDEALAALGEPRVRAASEGEGRIAMTALRYLERASTIHKRLLTGRVVCQAMTVLLAYDAATQTGSAWFGFGAVAFAALLYALAVAVTSHFAARRASRLALPLLRWVQPLELLMAPLAAPLVWAGNFLDRRYPPRPEDSPERVTEVEVERIIDQGEELGSIKEERAELLRSVIEFRKTVAREIMVPRTSMVAIDADMALPEVVGLMVREGHSRYPVYRDNIDHPIGILYAKDLFKWLGAGGRLDGALADLVRSPPSFAAETQKISDLLRQMQAKRVHLAIVVDEYGGTSGMVTLEDIIEEIVGEIRDEDDLEELPIQKIGPGRFMVQADASVHDVAEASGLVVPEGAANYDSLGGLLIDLAGRVPRNGESIAIGIHDVIVRDGDERRVVRVELVQRDRPASAAE
jgi:CBS domain containing-hemolysin-like protein